MSTEEILAQIKGMNNELETVNESINHLTIEQDIYLVALNNYQHVVSTAAGNEIRKMLLAYFEGSRAALLSKANMLMSKPGPVRKPRK